MDKGKLRFRYSVTFEFDTRAPVTHTGVVTGSVASGMFSKAVRTAQKALRPRGWSSCVCVLVERLKNG